VDGFDGLAALGVVTPGARCDHIPNLLHLAAALILPREDLVVAVSDSRLHAAARRQALAVLPESVDD